MKEGERIKRMLNKNNNINIRKAKTLCHAVIGNIHAKNILEGKIKCFICGDKIEDYEEWTLIYPQEFLKNR